MGIQARLELPCRLPPLAAARAARAGSKAKSSLPKRSGGCPRLIRADQIARADPDEAEPLTAGEACQGLKSGLIQGSCASGGFGYGAAPREAPEARGLQLQDDRPGRKAGGLETAGHAFRQRPQGRGEHFQIGSVMVERGLGRDALGLANR